MCIMSIVTATTMTGTIAATDSFQGIATRGRLYAGPFFLPYIGANAPIVGYLFRTAENLTDSP